MAWIVVVITVLSFLMAAAIMLLALRRMRVLRGRAGLSASRAAASPQGPHPARQYPARAPAIRTRTALIVCLVLLLEVVAAGGIATYFQRENIRQTELLQAEGVVTRARVVALEISEDDDGDETYYVTYTFVSRPGRAEEREITRQDRVPYDLYRRLEQGGWIEVIYAPSEPEVARITADYVPGVVNYLPAVIGAAVALPSLGVLMWFFSRYRRAARLDDEGVATTAEVLDMYEDSSGDSISYYIAYRLPGGEPFRQSISGSLYRQLQVGSHVTVRYLADDPGAFRVEEGQVAG